MTQAVLSQRADMLFSVEVTEPVASGLPCVARMATKELVKLGWAVMSGLSDAQITSLSTAFGNFDRVVGVGWLIADALGKPLPPRGIAHAAGLKARRAAGKVTTDEAAIRKAASDKARKQKLPPDDPGRLALAAEAEEKVATMLQEHVDLPLGDAPAAGSAGTGSRKRAREPESTEQIAVARAEEAHLNAEREIKRADAALTAAQKAADAKERVIGRWQRQFEAVDKRRKGALAQMQVLMKGMREAEAAWRKAEAAVEVATIDYLTAQISERDAQIDVLACTSLAVFADVERMGVQI